jgi:hypothetical protein
MIYRKLSCTEIKHKANKEIRFFSKIGFLYEFDFREGYFIQKIRKLERLEYI